MIYCVEDDAGIRELVVYTLKNTGFEAIGFNSAEPFYKELENNLPQLVLLDIMLPGDNGIEILKKIRKDSRTKNIPVIMLTAKSTEYDKVIGLDSGADDYITKPFGMMELVSRIKAVLRRFENDNDSGEVICYKNVRLNPSSYKVFVKDEAIDLTLKEFNVLKMLLENIGTVMTRDILLEKIWGYDFVGETRTVDVHIRTLRAKLGDEGNIIETIRGVGYKVGDK